MRKVKAIIWLLILLSIMVYTIPMGSAGTEVLLEDGLGEPELGQEEPVSAELFRRPAQWRTAGLRGRSAKG